MRRYDLVINDQPVTVNVKSLEHGESQLEVDGVTYAVRLTRQEVLPRAARTPIPTSASSKLTAPTAKAPAMGGSSGAGVVAAPIPGTVLEVFVKVGDKIEAGQPVLKLEAMKMENTISAPISGKVTSITVAKGAVVEQGQELAVIA